ncbi:MAG: hypothetical protein ACM3U1_04850 [Chloroflexota bacterium]
MENIETTEIPINSLWSKVIPFEYTLDKKEAEKINGKIRQIETEIESVRGRINHELNLMERITEEIKSRAVAGGAKTAETKELERHRLITESNIKAFEELLEPKLRELATLREGLAQEKEVSYQKLISGVSENMSSSLEEASVNAAELRSTLKKIFAFHKTLIAIHTDKGDAKPISAIRLHPEGIAEQFFNSLSTYFHQLKEHK